MAEVLSRRKSRPLGGFCLRRWESVFRDYPDILTNTENRNAVKRNIQKVKDYLQKLEDTL